MRLFAAVFVEENAARSLFERFASVAEMLKVKLVPPEKMHITLNFFGEADIKTCAELSRQAAAGCGMFEVIIKGAGCFIRSAGSGTLWAAASDENGKLKELALKTGNTVSVFTPHITLARFKNNFAAQKKIAEYIGENEVLDSFIAQKITLAESILTSAGASYGSVGEFQLNEQQLPLPCLKTQ